MLAVPGQSNRYLNERRGQPLSGAQIRLRTRLIGGGLARGKNRFITCAPFDCFWKGRAALVVTVVVQHLKINGGVRSFFLLEKAINAGVQEKSNQLISFVMLCMFNKLLVLKD
ncbi:hypothetical protein BK664_12885 [Pseudomonas brassicacearum]|uniref:Uncharacterized protein n=1 Tax=Pseudomonas brassicacearum TaxID=930166 RepID=A0A423JN32_9PSED|nr:hypothetical protein BK664_12885 [Pseudomonas brassicacearum]